MTKYFIFDNAESYLKNEIKMGSCTTREREIISEKSLLAVKKVLQVLRESDILTPEIFSLSCQNTVQQHIYQYLRNGKTKMKFLLSDAFDAEIASALLDFLKSLREPLLPVRVQKLIIGKHEGIDKISVAEDATGLLNEELTGRRRELVYEVFDVFKKAVLNRNQSEFSSFKLPKIILKLFLKNVEITPDQWNDISLIFYEMTSLVPEVLKNKRPGAVVKSSRPVRLLRCNADYHNNGGEPSLGLRTLTNLTQTMLHPVIRRI